MKRWTIGSERFEDIARVDTIKQLRDGTQDLSEQELARALKALESGKPAADVLTQLSRNLTNKFLHAPTVACAVPLSKATFHFWMRRIAFFR